jgi:predicted amidohydrolase YtcJ
MMTRRDANGEPVWPQEAISLTDALRAYTVNGAYASFEEGIKGRLQPGMVGDVTIFETDLESVAPEEVGQVQIDATILDGQVVYERRI